MFKVAHRKPTTDASCKKSTYYKMQHTPCLTHATDLRTCQAIPDQQDVTLFSLSINTEAVGQLGHGD